MKRVSASSRPTDVTALRRLGLLVAAAGLAATCGGCADDPPRASPPGAHAAPTRSADCNDLPALDGDPGILLGTDWSGELHDYGDTVVVYACVSASLGGHVSLVVDGTGIQVRPRVAPVDPSGSGVIPFRVTVSNEASGEVRIQQKGGNGEADLLGPVVAGEGDGWHFVPHER